MKTHGIKAVACRPVQVYKGVIAQIAMEPKGTPAQDEFYQYGFFQVVEGEAPARFFFECEDDTIWDNDPAILLHKANQHLRWRVH